MNQESKNLSLSLTSPFPGDAVHDKRTLSLASSIPMGG